MSFVSYSKGKVKAMPGLDVVSKLPSFVGMPRFVSFGSEVQYSIDLIMCPGSCVLMNEDGDVLRKDVEFIRYLEDINRLRARPTAATFGRGAKGLNRAASMNRPNLLRIMTQDRPELRGGRLVKKFATLDASKEGRRALASPCSRRALRPPHIKAVNLHPLPGSGGGCGSLLVRVRRRQGDPKSWLPGDSPLDHRVLGRDKETRAA